MDKFTVEEINLMCVFEGQDRTGMIADIKNAIPHIQDRDMVELAEQVIGKLEAMSDEEFAGVALEAADGWWLNNLPHRIRSCFAAFRVLPAMNCR